MEEASAVVNLALCGFGRAGHMHLTSIRSNHRCVLKYVVEVPEMMSSATLELSRLNMREVSVVSPDQFRSIVLKDKDVAAVMITTPTDQHEEYIKLSLWAGKAVFCEKPVANNMTSVKQCYKQAQEAGLPLFCAFNRRFDPSFSSLWQQLQDGNLGRVHFISSTSRDSPLPSMAYLKISNGIYHDCAVHDIDMLCWLVGEEPVHVYAQGHAQNEEIAAMNDVDTVAIILTFPSGVIGAINISRHSSYGYDQRLEVLGDKGMLAVNNPHSLSLVSSTGNGINSSPYQYSFPTRYEVAYSNELHHFLDCVMTGQAVKISMNDTLLATRIADACERSAQSKKAEPLEPLL